MAVCPAVVVLVMESVTVFVVEDSIPCTAWVAPCFVFCPVSVTVLPMELTPFAGAVAEVAEVDVVGVEVEAGTAVLVVLLVMVLVVVLVTGAVFVTGAAAA